MIRSKSRKLLLIIFLLLALSQFSPAFAWEEKNNGQANKDAHDAAACIVLGNQAVDKFSSVSGSSLYRDTANCSKLEKRWYSSGLTYRDAQTLMDDNRHRNVYLTSQGTWRIEFCKRQGFLGDMRCETLPY